MHRRLDESAPVETSTVSRSNALVELTNIYATAPVGLSCVDRELRYVSVNDRMAAIHGLPAAAHLGRTLRELIPDLAERVEGTFRHVLETGAPVVDLEYRGTTPADSSHEHTWVASYSPVTDAGGGVAGVSVVVQDVTERRAGERRLREAIESRRQGDEFLHVVGDQLPRAMFFRVVHPPNQPFRFTYVSRGVEDVLGITPEHLLAHPEALVEGVVDDDRQPFLDRMAYALSTISAFDMLCRMRWPDGSLHWCHFRSGHRVGTGGEVLCEGIALDITALREAEEALVETETQRQAILSALPDLMFLMTADGVYLDFHCRNPADLAQPPDKLLGRSIFDVLPAELAQQVAVALHQVKTDGSAALDYALTLGGERRFFEARLVPCGMDEVLSIVRDVTDIKRSQSEAHLSRLELAHVSRITLLAEITASLAHELNQPLTAIVSNAQAARHAITEGRLEPHEYQDMLDDIIEAGRRAGDVIGRLRTWLNRDEFLPQPIDVNEVISHVEHLIRSELILRNVRLSLELDSELRAVAADRVQLQQVMLNLAMNAIDALDGRVGPDRHLVIRTSGVGDEVQVAVRDRGTGIPAECQDRLFDAFFSTKPAGLGIGLRICSSIVSAHGGRMWATNNDDGAGATFGFALPAVQHRA